MPKNEPLDKKLYEKVKQIADEKYEKPSAFKSSFIVKLYKQYGGEYSGVKTTDGLTRWHKEQWKNVANPNQYPTLRPTRRINKKTPLTASEISPSNLKKQVALKQVIKGDKNLPSFIRRK